MDGFKLNPEMLKTETTIFSKGEMEHELLNMQVLED